MDLATAVRRLGGAAAIVIALGACSSDTPEAVQSALDEAAPTLAFADDSTGSCIATALYDTVGFEQLALDGHTSSSITLEPESVELIFTANDSPELRDTIAGCIDADETFRAQLISQTAETTLDCDTTFASGNELVDAAVAQFIDSDTTPIDINDDNGNRDLLRPCLSEAAFAEVFGIDLADDLITAIDANLGDAVRDDEQPCVGPLILEAAGSAEAANALGITVDDPSFTLTSIGLTGEALEQFTLDVFACGSMHERETNYQRLHEPVFGPCVVEELSDNDSWMQAEAEFALGAVASERTSENRQRRALDQCLRDKINELYDEPVGAEVGAAKAFGEGLYESIIEADPGVEKYGASLAEMQCAAFWVIREFDMEAWIAVATPVEFEGQQPTAEYFALANELWGGIAHGLRLCGDDFTYIAGDLQRAGFSTNTLDCVRSDLDVPYLADIYEALTTDYTSISALEADGLAYSISDAIERCYDAEEQDIYDEWYEWVNSEYTDSFGGEPDLVEA